MAMLPLPGWETWEKNLRSLSELHEKITGKVIDSCEDQVNETLIDITHKYLAERVNKEFEKLFGRKVYKGERLDMESVSGIDGTVATETPDIELYRASGHYDYEGHVIYTSDLARDIMSLVSGFDDDDNVIGVNYNTVDNYPGIWPGAWEYLKEHIKLLSTPCRFLKEEEIQLLSTEICKALEGIKDANVGGWLEKEWEDDEENDEEDEEDEDFADICSGHFDSRTIADELKKYRSDYLLTESPIFLLAVYFTGAVDFGNYETVEVVHPVLYKSKALGRFLETYRPGIDEGIDELWNYLHSPWYTSWSYGGEGVILTFSLKDNASCDAIGSNEEKEYVKETPSLWLASALCVIDRLTDYMERRTHETKGHSGEPEHSLQQCG